MLVRSASVLPRCSLTLSPYRSLARAVSSRHFDNRLQDNVEKRHFRYCLPTDDRGPPGTAVHLDTACGTESIARLLAEYVCELFYTKYTVQGYFEDDGP